MYWQAPEQDNKPPLDECYQLPRKREIFHEINFTTFDISLTQFITLF